MEDTLRVTFNSIADSDGVLILVLMEDTLRVRTRDKLQRVKMS